MDANTLFLLLACVPSGYVISRPVVNTLRGLWDPVSSRALLCAHVITWAFANRYIAGGVGTPSPLALS